MGPGLCAAAPARLIRVGVSIEVLGVVGSCGGVVFVDGDFKFDDVFFHALVAISEAAEGVLRAAGEVGGGERIERKGRPGEDGALGLDVPDVGLEATCRGNEHNGCDATIPKRGPRSRAVGRMGGAEVYAGAGRRVIPWGGRRPDVDA